MALPAPLTLKPMEAEHTAQRHILNHAVPAVLGKRIQIRRNKSSLIEFLGYARVARDMRRNDMRPKLTLALFVASFLAGASLAPAQTATITIGDDVRTEFRTYITTENVTPIEVADAEIAVGATLPETVVLQPVPDVIVAKAPELEGHRYVLVGSRIIVVEPSSTKIVAVLEE